MLFAPAVDKNGSGSPASSAGVLPSDESSSSSSGASDAYPSPAFSDNLSLPDVDSPSSASDPSRPPKSSAGKRSKRKKGGFDDDDESSTTYRMSRDRAPSVGLDGPLFGDETDGATTPGTDSDASDYMSAASAARGSLPGAGDFAGHTRSLRGDGVPRGGFKLGLTEVNSRPAAASSATATDE